VSFSESNSRFLIEVAQADQKDFERLMKGKNCAQIGKVTKEPKLVVTGLKGKVVVDAPIEKLRRSWKSTLSPQEATQ
jgi:phosphoribosylformylglycinamidine (FGAM) synthase-like enzyme